MCVSLMTQFFNKTSEKEKRRSLRNNMPPTEALLWSRLRNNQVPGYKFRRQYGVGPYVIDFFCPALKLAVEIDGDSHFVTDALKNDERRQAFIESFGIHFLRFTNHEVNRELEAVLEKICQFVNELTGQKYL